TIPSGSKHTITVTSVTGNLGAFLDTTYPGTNGSGVNNSGGLVAITIPAQGVPASGSFKLSNVLLSLAGTTIGQSVSASISVSSASGNVTLGPSSVVVISNILPLLNATTNPPGLVPGTQ